MTRVVVVALLAALLAAGCEEPKPCVASHVEHRAESTQFVPMFGAKGVVGFIPIVHKAHDVTVCDRRAS